MPFTKTNISEEIKQMKKEDKEFAKIYEIVEKEHAIIRQAARIRKRMKVTQPEMAKLLKTSQQAISRFEKVGHSPTLNHLIKYLDAIGYELKIQKKRTKTLKRLRTKRKISNS